MVTSPEEVIVRWVNKQSRAMDPKGNLIAVDATVHVDRDVAIGSEMWLGTLAEWLGTGSGGADAQVMEVKTFNVASDYKNRFLRREAGLVRFRETPATG